MTPGKALAPDLLLVEQIRRGDADAGRRFFQEYYPDIYRYLLWLAERPEAAEDLAQETFVRAWRHLAAFDGRASLRTWLQRIARRGFLRFLQRQRAQTPLGDAAEVADTRASGWTDVVELREVVRKLPTEEAEAVVLYYLQGYDWGEIARIVGAPVSTVKYRLLTARAHLQRELGDGDLVYLNEPVTGLSHGGWLPLEQIQQQEGTMERREFLRHAKMTFFCKKRPLREVMRQLRRPFGYTWLRSGQQGEYRYELVQDLRSQLLEEEMRRCGGMSLCTLSRT